MRLPSITSAIILLPLALGAGCAAPGPFPSLAPRPVERELAELDAAQATPTVLPDDPALSQKVSALLAEAQRGQAEFENMLDAASKAVRSAGPAGTDSWVEAQQAISRLEAARFSTVRTLADLDELALARAGQPTSAADLARIEAAMAQVQALGDSQQERIDALGAALKPL